MHIAMTSMHVTDPQAAHAFYTGVLGFRTLLAEPEQHLFVVQDDGEVPGPGLLLEPSDPEVGEPYRRALYERGIPALVLGTADVDEDYERLTAAGVPFQAAPEDDASGRSATFDDTVGNWVRLAQLRPLT